MSLIPLLVVFIGGIAGGLYGSTVGGGALVSLPLLILIGTPIHVALGTQRLAAVFLEGISAIRFHKAKKFDPKIAIPLALVAALGSIIGVTLVVNINGKILNIIIGVMLSIIAFVLLNKDRLGIKEHALTHKHLFLLFITMVPLGIYQGFLGAGFGVFIAMTFVLFGFRFLEASAIGRVVGVVGSIVGAIIFAEHGLINYLYGITLGFGFGFGSWIGIGVALKKDEKYIKGLILFVVIFSVVKLILNYFNINFI